MNDKPDYFRYIKQAFELQNQKLYKEAIEVLFKVLCEDADDDTVIEVVSQIGDLHVLLKNYDRAIEQYEHVLELAPNHEHSRAKLYDIYYMQNNYEKALEVAKNLCEVSKKPLDYVRYFNVLFKLKRSDEILDIYSKFNDNLKKDPSILYVISLIDEKNRKQILEEIVNSSPISNDAKFDLGVIYYEEGRYEEAENLFNSVLLVKKDAFSYYYKALSLIEKKEFFPAIDCLHLAIKASKEPVQEFYFALAKTYMDVNWFEEAITTIKKSITLCIEQNEDSVLIDKRYLLLAWVFEKQNDYDNALFNLALINENSKVKVQADILRALVSYKKGETIKAKDELERIYKENVGAQNDLTLLDTLGAIYKDLKLNAKACDFYKKHLEYYPDSIYTVCELIDLLIDMEKYDEAEEYIQKCAKDYKAASILNSKARIYYRKQEYDKALGALDELLMYDRNNAEGYYFKGLVLFQMGKYKEASVFSKAALELNPKPAKYYAQMAKAQYELNLYEDAKLYIKEAIEIEPNDLNYKKLAAKIAQSSGNTLEANFWNAIVSRSEAVLKDLKR